MSVVTRAKAKAKPPTSLHKGPIPSTSTVSKPLTRSQRTSERSVRQNYNLNEDKTIKKKLDQCDRESPISFKLTGGGLRLWCQTGAYEILKEAVQKWYNNQDSTKAFLTKKEDKHGSIVEITYRITKSADGSHLYSVNMYHTKSSALVNGRHLEVFMEKELPAVLHLLKANKAALEKINKSYKNLLLEHQAAIITPPTTEAPDDSGGNEFENETALESAEATQLCLLCEKPCLHDGVWCDTCENWIHYECEGLADPTVIRELEEDDNDQYECHSCIVLKNPTITPSNAISNSSDAPTSTNASRAAPKTVAMAACTVSSISGNTSKVPQHIDTHRKEVQSAHLSTSRNDLQAPLITQHIPPDTANQDESETSSKHQNSKSLPPVAETETIPDSPSHSQTPQPTIINSSLVTLDQLSKEKQQRRHREKVTEPKSKTSPPSEDDTRSLEREKELRVKEKQLQTREKLLKQQERDNSEVIQQLAVAKAYILKLEDNLKALREENRLIRLKLLTSSEQLNENLKDTQTGHGKCCHHQPVSTASTTQFQKLDLELLLMKTESSVRHASVMEEQRKQSLLLTDILSLMKSDQYRQTSHSTAHHREPVCTPEYDRIPNKPHRRRKRNVKPATYQYPTKTTEAEYPLRRPARKAIIDYNHGPLIFEYNHCSPTLCSEILDLDNTRSPEHEDSPDLYPQSHGAEPSLEVLPNLSPQSRCTEKEIINLAVVPGVGGEGAAVLTQLYEPDVEVISPHATQEKLLNPVDLPVKNLEEDQSMPNPNIPKSYNNIRVGPELNVENFKSVICEKQPQNSFLDYRKLEDPPNLSVLQLLM